MEGTRARAPGTEAVVWRAGSVVSGSQQEQEQEVMLAPALDLRAVVDWKKAGVVAWQTEMAATAVTVLVTSQRSCEYQRCGGHLCECRIF